MTSFLSEKENQKGWEKNRIGGKKEKEERRTGVKINNLRKVRMEFIGSKVQSAAKLKIEGNKDFGFVHTKTEKK